MSVQCGQKVGLLAWDNVSKEVKQARYHCRNAACKYKTNSMCEYKNVHA